MATLKFYTGLVIAALGLLATAGCGAGGAGLLTGQVQGSQLIDEKWAVHNEPVFRSAHGMKLYALDRGGFPTGPEAAGPAWALARCAEEALQRAAKVEAGEARA